MHVDIVTLFPSLCASPLNESILKRAQESGRVTIRAVDLRRYTHDRHRTTDERPYGGGAGMVLKPEPLFEAVEDLRGGDTWVVLLTPQGVPLRQQVVERLSLRKHLILICGHYEGVDERVRQVLVDEEISIGDYILTNGGLAALVVTDAVVRLLPGVLGSDESATTESFGKQGLLDFPQYTRPEAFRGMHVPPVLLSGDHGAVQAWRQEQSIRRTAARRPDLLSRGMETIDE